MFKPPLSLAENEIRVQEVAVQLLEVSLLHLSKHTTSQLVRADVSLMLQTLDGLHHACKFAHMDISSNNIMLRSSCSDKWDRLGLLDFGFAQKCVTGVPSLFGILMHAV